MASIIANISRNRQGTIVRGVRILRSEYNKQTKRDNLTYLGTIPQGVVEIPASIAMHLKSSEHSILTEKLAFSANAYLQQREEKLAAQLEVVHKAYVELGKPQPRLPSEIKSGSSYVAG